METKDLAARMESLMTEALTLRSSVHLPKVTDQADEVLVRLQQARQAQDRVEEIMLIIGRSKAMAQRQKTSFENVADDAWANALRNLRALPTFRNTEYVGPRERYAEADLSTMEHKANFRRAEEELSYVVEAYDFVRTIYFGLNGVRDDIKDILRKSTFQSRLET
jgi:hypothetical protein